MSDRPGRETSEARPPATGQQHAAASLGGADADAADTPKRSITRRDFEGIIRRAAELSASEAEEGADELLSEDEVIRIATEVGLPARHVRQALFELPEIDPETGERGGYFGDPIIAFSRVVPGKAGDVLRRMEDYLTTREYLQVVRRRPQRVFLMPAEDTISSLARGLLRPSRRYFLARARRVVVSVRPIEDNQAHVQIALDLSQQRRDASRTAWFGGGAFGLVVGGGAAVALAFADLPTAVGVAAQIAAFATGFAGTVAGVFAASRAAFRKNLEGARFELDGLLDRAEHGQSLEPPPAPWRKRLQQKLLGS
ncbi:MAG: hypothetical protein L0271_19205 [Gemmatimonadetes bacterium]|nr:hypothetical protein [Gemmatimonadota bacterium]